MGNSQSTIQTDPKTKFNIGIIGETFSGKSTFINTIRNLKPGAPGAAAVRRNTACTEKPRFYEFPINKNITLVDLPGIFSSKIRKEEYFEQFYIKTYVNYFVLIHCIGSIL